MSTLTPAELASDTAQADSARTADEQSLRQIMQSQNDRSCVRLAMRAVAEARRETSTCDLRAVTDRVSAEIAGASAKAMSAAHSGDAETHRRAIILVRRMERTVARNCAEMAARELEAARRALARPVGGAET